MAEHVVMRSPKDADQDIGRAAYDPLVVLAASWQSVAATQPLGTFAQYGNRS
jgi:hypothetical protein